MEKITVALITCNRLELFKKAFMSYLNLTKTDHFESEIIVINNTNSQVEENWFNQLQQKIGFNGSFHYELQRGVTYPRNKALQLSTGSDFLAFYDDDEELDSNWLIELYNATNKYKADVVSGHTEYLYPSSAPQWMKKYAVHGALRQMEGSVARSASTNNVMYRVNFLTCHNLSFDNRLANIGGEDSMIFNQIVLSGGVAFNAPLALNFEYVHINRISIFWLLRRHYSYGYSHSLQSTFIRGRSQTVLRILKEAFTHLLGTGVNIIKSIAYFDFIYLFYALRHMSKLSGRVMGVLKIGRYEEYK
jgi:succinoglycan biosynthesis protein ExoM